MSQSVEHTWSAARPGLRHGYYLLNKTIFTICMTHEVSGICLNECYLLTSVCYKQHILIILFWWQQARPSIFCWSIFRVYIIML